MNEIKMENDKATGTLCGTVIEGRPQSGRTYPRRERCSFGGRRSIPGM
jgi:hypothetical protein